MLSLTAEIFSLGTLPSELREIMCVAEKAAFL
jgi:hypothetical protein